MGFYVSETDVNDFRLALYLHGHEDVCAYLSEMYSYIRICTKHLVSLSRLTLGNEHYGGLAMWQLLTHPIFCSCRNSL